MFSKNVMVKMLLNSQVGKGEWLIDFLSLALYLH